MKGVKKTKRKKLEKSTGTAGNGKTEGNRGGGSGSSEKEKILHFSPFCKRKGFVGEEGKERTERVPERGDGGKNSAKRKEFALLLCKTFKF